MSRWKWSCRQKLNFIWLFKIVQTLQVYLVALTSCYLIVLKKEKKRSRWIVFVGEKKFQRVNSDSLAGPEESCSQFCFQSLITGASLYKTNKEEPGLWASFSQQSMKWIWLKNLNLPSHILSMFQSLSLACMLKTFIYQSTDCCSESLCWIHVGFFAYLQIKPCLTS